MPVEISETDLEWQIWLGVYRAGFCADRYPDDPLSLKRGLNYWTGAPESANELKRPGQIKMRGATLQRASFFMPSIMAMAWLRRPCGSCDACKIGEEVRCEDGPTYKYLHRDQWTAEEAANVHDLEQRIQAVFLRWEEQHYLVRRPPVLYTGDLAKEQQWLAKDGQDSWAAFFTPRGIDKAKEMCEREDAPSWVRDAVRDNRRSPLWAMDHERRARAPQWQQKEFIAEGGRIEASAPVDGPLVTRCGRCDQYHAANEPCGGGFVEEMEKPGVLRRFWDALTKSKNTGNGRRRR